jgi:cephalosporin-C deacetylase-like acetyl esterase
MKHLILLLAIPLLLAACGRRPDEAAVRNEPPPEAANNIRLHLQRVARELTAKARAEVLESEAWQGEANLALRRQEFAEMLSLQDMPPDDERPPLNPVVTGVVQQDGFRIENLYYESLPGLYVPGNLYIPDNLEGPAPAVIYLCGHSHTQKEHYQTHPRKLARLGFVCLIVETIQYGEVWGEHWGCYDRGWFNWYSRGYTPAGVEVWNAIRGLDLLSQRPEVDAGRLGVTGISGGGAQAWFVAAVDPRIRAAAPVCGNSTLEAQIRTRTIDGHCDCMLHLNTRGWDFQHIGALIAPRPLFIAQADRDGLNTIESSRAVYEDLKAVYDRYGAGERLGFIATPGGHSYHRTSREAIFSFFLRHLAGKEIPPEQAGDIDTTAADRLSGEALRVYRNGPPAGDRTSTIQNSFVRLAPAPDIADAAALAAHRDAVIAFLREKTFHAFPEVAPAFDARLEFRTLDYGAYGMKTYSFITEEDWRLKLKVHYAKDSAELYPLMIVLRSPDETRRSSEAFISDLAGDWNTAYFEVRGTGEAGWAPELQWHVRRAAAWTGRTLASMRVYDVLRCLEFARSLPGVDPDRIGLAARGEMGAVALYAALLDGRCSRILLQDPPATQDAPSRGDGRGESIEMLNALRITDLGRLPALLHPAGVALVGTVPDTYEWSLNTLRQAGLPVTVQRVGSLSELPAAP